MNTILFGIITVSIVVAVIFFIIIMLEVKDTVKRLREFLANTENSLQPTLIELQSTIKNIRELTDETTAVTKGIRLFSDSIKDIGEQVRNVSINVKRMSKFLDDITSTAIIETSGIKAGLKAGALTFMKNLFKLG